MFIEFEIYFYNSYIDGLMHFLYVQRWIFFIKILLVSKIRF